MLDQVPDNRRLADPPLMRLESEGGHAYLSILLQLSATQTEVQQQAEVEAGLVSLSLATLQRFQVYHGLAMLHLAAPQMLVLTLDSTDDGAHIKQLCVSVSVLTHTWTCTDLQSSNIVLQNTFILLTVSCAF